MDLLDYLEQLEEPDFITPIPVWDDFQGGHVWRDMKRELYVWLANTWRLLETETDPDKIGELRGRARTIREFMRMPENIQLMIKEKGE